MDIKYFLLIIYSIIYAILSFLLLNIYILFHFQFFRTKKKIEKKRTQKPGAKKLWHRKRYKHSSKKNFV